MESGIIPKLKRLSSTRSGQLWLVFSILFASLLVRLALFPVPGFQVDSGTFSSWFRTAAEGGISGFYNNTSFCDYPPFNIYIFWLFGKMAQVFGWDTLPFFIKLPQNLFDLAAAYLIFAILRMRLPFSASLAAMSLYAFNPAVIFNLAVWGQMDSIYTFFMVASLFFAFKSRFEISGGLFCLAMLTKPQSIILLPLLAYLILRYGGWQRAVSSSVIFGGVLALVILPFAWDNPVTFLIEQYSGYDVYPYTSVNAFNLWALAGLWKPDNISQLGLTYQIWGILAFFAAAILLFWFYRHSRSNAALFVFMLMLAFFMLMTRMHERYLFPAFAFLLLAWPLRMGLWLYLGLTCTFLANLVIVYTAHNAGNFVPSGAWYVTLLSVMNLVLMGAASAQYWLAHREVPLVRPIPALVDEGDVEEEP